MDVTDRKLLTLIQADNQRNLRDLAEELNISAPTCLRRLRRLNGNGTVRANVALLNPAKAGFGVTAFVHITLESTSGQALRAFESAMAKNKRVLQCNEISGEIDYILFVIARDMEDLGCFLLESLGSNKNVTGYRSHLVMRAVKNDHALPLF